jgi:hypothetical protein
MKMWRRAYKTKVSDGCHEAIGRGPTPEAYEEAAKKRWVEVQAAEKTLSCVPVFATAQSNAPLIHPALREAIPGLEQQHQHAAVASVEVDVQLRSGKPLLEAA